MVRQSQLQSNIAARQTGAALIVGLIFMALVGLLGTAAYSVSTQQERMSGNSRDRIRATEAAEAALRDCEAAIGSLGGVPVFNNTGGMYQGPSATEVPIWTRTTFDWTSATATRVLAAPMTDVAMQPRCVAEELDVVDVKPNEVLEAREAMETESVYRITAAGYGTNLNTRVIVQSTFRRR